MDLITQKHLDEFSQEHDLAHLDESKRFEHFASFCVIKQHHAVHFDTGEIGTGDGELAHDKGDSGTDTGIDGIAILVNGSLITDADLLSQYAEDTSSIDSQFIFIQSETSSSFDAAKIGTFGNGVRDFFRQPPKMKRNKRVESAAAIAAGIYDLSSKFPRNPVCRLYYVTTGKWQDDQNLLTRIEIVKDDLKSLMLFSAVEFIPVGAERLQELYRQTRNANSKTFEFPHKTSVGDFVQGVEEAYIGFLPAKHFVRLITRDSGDDLLPGLFEGNVRDWEGYNKVNQEIKATLSSGKDDRFVLMNNGITIIARKVATQGNRLTMTDFQIVNGCQTSHVLFDNRAVLTDAAMVPIRIIGTSDVDVTKDVVRATNRQTEIKEDQFFALQEFPKQLEQYFSAFPDVERRLYYERRTGQYDRLPIEKARISTEASVVRSFASLFLDEPHRTTRNYRGLRDKVGKDIFHKSHRPEPYYASAVAFYKLESLFRKGKIEAHFKPARFHILMSARMIASKEQIPQMGSKGIANYCGKFVDVLWHADKSDALLLAATQLVEKAAGGDFQRDNIRTERFTDKVKNLAS